MRLCAGWPVTAGFVLAALSAAATAEVPAGWHANGSALNDYTVATDTSVTHQGHKSVAVTGKTLSPNGFGGLMQMTAADDFKKKRVRLSAWLKTSEASVGGAHLWFRVDGPDRKVLAFNNMDARPVMGTTDWKKYAIVLDVPEESTALAYGFFLSGGGTVWAAEFKLEQVGSDVPTTENSNLPSHPANLDFDQ